MHLALKEAEKASMEGEVPVGAILVKNKKIIALSHNKKESRVDPTAHAEIIAIQKGTSETGNWRLSDTTLYVTKEPCVMCAGAMVNARLGRLVYGCKDEKYGAVKSRYEILFDGKLNHQVKVISGILENECSDILKRFFQVYR